MSTNIHCKFGYRITADGKRYTTWDLTFNDIWLGVFKTQYKAIGALTVRKVPYERAIAICNKTTPKTTSKSVIFNTPEWDLII